MLSYELHYFINCVVDRDIAKYLIANHENINSLSISELAKNTNVSISQVSRFVRSLGIESFSDFKEALVYHGEQKRHTGLQREIIDYRVYQKMVTEEITYFYQNFDESRVDKLVYDFYKYPKIAIFGILNSDNGAKELQYNLIGWGKICISYTNFQDQLDFIKSADSNTLIVIFSFSGSYVMKNGYSRFYHTYDYLKSSKAKVYVITKNYN